jgi:hypothetical protein
MTLNNRLATAAAAMVHRMTIRRRPRVFLPVSPLRKGSIPTEAITAAKEREENSIIKEKKG